jgi:hypothetical protein
MSMSPGSTQPRDRVPRARRLAAGLVIVMAASVAASAVTATPASAHFVPNPNPPIVGLFAVSPTQGPVGTHVTYQGFCGFPATTITYGLVHQVALEALVAAQVSIQSTPLGSFAPDLTIPAVSIAGETITPGTYYAFAICDFGLPTETLLPAQPFEVTAGCRNCVRDSS